MTLTRATAPDGAIAAVLLAAKYPERVEKLIIFGGNAYFDKDDVEAFESTRDVSTQWSKRMLETHLPVYGDDLQVRVQGAGCVAAAGVHVLVCGLGLF